MANLLNNPSMIAAEALTHLEDQLVITQVCAKDKTADFMQKPNGYAIGSTVQIKQYGEYETKEFTGATEVQDIRNSTRDMTIEKHFDISVEIGAKEQALSFDGFSEEVLKPALGDMAETIDDYVGTKFLNASGLYVSSALFETAADMSAARKAATLQQLKSGRLCMCDLSLEATILGLPVFNQSQTGGQDAEYRFREGHMGRMMGMDFGSSIGFPEATHTGGTGVTTTNSTVSTNLIGLSVLTVDALTGQIEEGDRIMIAGVRRPVIAAAVAAAASTEISLVNPINEIIPDGAAVTVIGSGETFTYRGAIMDDRSIAIAMPLLDTPSDKPAAVMSKNGFSLRVVRGYDMNSKKEKLSIDCLVGSAMWDPRRVTLLADY